MSGILEIVEIGFFYFPISWKYWKLDSSVFSYTGNAGGGRAEAGGRLQGLCCAALDYFWNVFPGISGYPGNIGNMVFLYFGFFSKKVRAKISRKMHQRMSRDLSYETDSGPKTKTVYSANLCTAYCVLYICRKSFDSIDS